MQNAGWTYEEASGGQSQHGVGADAITYWRNNQYTSYLKLNSLNLKGLSGINKIGIKWGSSYSSSEIFLFVNGSQRGEGTGSAGLIHNGSINTGASSNFIELYETEGINKVYYIFLSNT